MHRLFLPTLGYAEDTQNCNKECSPLVEGCVKGILVLKCLRSEGMAPLFVVRVTEALLSAKSCSQGFDDNC